MAESRPIDPFFHARATYAFKPNRFYRVYVTAAELIFVEAGPGDGQQVARQMAMQGGLIGGLIGALVAKQKQKKAAARARALDDSTAGEIVRLADEGKNNFRSRASEIDEASFEPPGLKNTHAGRLRLRHRERGKMTLEVATVDDMRTALDTVPPLLGDTVKINVVWDEKKKGFVRKR
jgi:hypothetical protein